MDEIVFNDIYDKYVNPVWRTALYYSGNQTDAEEITQLTFIQLLISYETIQNKDAIEAWLLTTARRLVYSRKRKAKWRHRCVMSNWRDVWKKKHLVQMN